MNEPTPKHGCALLILVTVGLWAMIMFMFVLTFKTFMYE
jgi:hypothetical protein